jgi:hypothetical protein
MRNPPTQRSRREARAGQLPPKEAALSILCMTGKSTGQELTLLADRPLLFGRSRQADVKLEDDLASRQHTRINFVDGKFHVEDLGSKNGTLLNGQRIAGPTPLKAGDYIRIGESTFHVVQPCVAEDKARSWWEKTQNTFATMKQDSDRGGGAGPLVSGSLSEISLLDFIQLLGNSMKSGLITVRCGVNKGEVFLRQGQVYYAMANHVAAIRPDKVLCRMLRWKDGSFTFTPNTEHLVENEITENTGALLLEGVRQADELTAYESVLPALDAILRLATPLPEPLRSLLPEELDLVQLVLEHKVMVAVLDAHPGSDLDACTALAGLFQRKIIVAETPATV